MIILVSRRKSLSGNWKTNIGQSLLEEIPVSGHHKLWIDEVRAFECFKEVKTQLTILSYTYRFLNCSEDWVFVP